MHMMYDLKKKYFKDNKLLRINENTKVKDLCPFFSAAKFFILIEVNGINKDYFLIWCLHEVKIILCY